nr:hypothetical protein [Janthinobacterium sp. JC611]
MVVGGAVRDVMLGMQPRDVDLVTDASVEDLASLFPQARRSGTRFMVVVVKMGEEFIEIATLRRKDGTMVLDGSDAARAPASLWMLLNDDSTQRDFTLNAIYYDPLAQRLYDPCDGIADIRQRLVRPISGPVACIKYDALTMVRAVRFSRCRRLGLEPQMEVAIPAHAALLATVSTDRRLLELMKQLRSGHALTCMTQICRLQLHYGLLPSLDALLEDNASGRFLTIALSAFDAQPGLSSYASLLATLLWPAVRTARALHALTGGGPNTALKRAGLTVLASEGAPLDLERHLGPQITSIWQIQGLLEDPINQDITTLPLQASFRPGLNLLMLRCEAGEVPANVGQLWLAHYAVRERTLSEQAISESD